MTLTRFFFMVLSVCLAAVPLPALLIPPLQSLSYRPGQILLRFKAQASSQALAMARDGLLVSLGARTADKIEALGVERWSLPAGVDPRIAAAQARLDPAVASAEPNFLAHASACGPNDPLLGEQWYHAAIHAGEAYCAGTPLKATITAAVVDTGIFGGHQDFAGQMVPGFDFVHNVGSANDDFGHGTHVASILAARTGEGVGMAGVAFSNVKLMPIKVLDSAGEGDIFTIARGVQYAADHGARVINMSLGTPEPSDTLEQACTYALTRSCVVVAAAGNHNVGESTATSYPAAYASVISVGALTSQGGPAYYSNFGRVDLSAPGGDGQSFSCACSPLPVGGPCAGFEILGACFIDPSNYSKAAGTSFSCPMVAAAAALLLAQEPSRSPAEVLRVLQETADATSQGAGYHDRTGWGRVNLFRALNSAETGFNVMAPALKLYAWPNPFSPARQGFSHLTFYLESPQAARLRLFDMAGETVYEWNLDPSQTHTGLNYVNWDGRNGVGSIVASGAYSLTLQAGSRKARTNIGLLR